MFEFFYPRRAEQDRHILEKLTHIERKLEKIVAVTQAQLDTALATVEADLTTFLAAVSALIAKINAGADFTSELATVTAMDTAISTASAADIPPPVVPPAG